MTLEEDIEPVCVEGIETETAVERIRDLNQISKTNYWVHRIPSRKTPALIFAEGCFLISFGTPLSVLSGIVALAASVYYDIRLAREQKQAVSFLEANYRH